MYVLVFLGILYAFLTLPIFPYMIFPKIKRPYAVEVKDILSCGFPLFLCCSSIFLTYKIFNLYSDYSWHIYLIPLIFPIIIQIMYATSMLKKKKAILTIIALSLIVVLICVNLKVKVSI